MREVRREVTFVVPMHKGVLSPKKKLLGQSRVYGRNSGFSRDRNENKSAQGNHFWNIENITFLSLRGDHWENCSPMSRVTANLVKKPTVTLTDAFNTGGLQRLSS